MKELVWSLLIHFKIIKEDNDLLGKTFDETHACNSSSSDDIENTNLICDLERKEVIFGIPLCFECNGKIKDEQIHMLSNNVDVLDIGALHQKVMVMLGPHMINSYLDPS